MLPLGIISNGCRAKLKHGLLRIDVPKRVVLEKQEKRLTLDDTCAGFMRVTDHAHRPDSHNLRIR